MEKRKTKILIIDDEADFCYFIKQNLEAAGAFDVGTCSESSQGLENARQLRPDLILLDIMMPIKDGFTVLRELKADELTWTIPVIMLTVSIGQPSMPEFIEFGAKDYLFKMCDTPTLLQCIKRYI